MKARIVNLKLVILGNGGEETVSKLAATVMKHLLLRKDEITSEQASGANDSLTDDRFNYKIKCDIERRKVSYAARIDSGNLEIIDSRPPKRKVI